MTTLEKIESLNEFIHNHLSEFVETILSEEGFENKLYKNRCKEPFRHSKDNDFSYSEETGSWHDFGGSRHNFKSSFDLVRELKFGNEPNFKKQVALTIKLLDEWQNGRSSKKVYFRTHAKEKENKSFASLLADKLEETNSNIAENYVNSNMKKWFQQAKIARFTEEAIKTYHVCEATKNLPRGLSFFHYYYFYMIYDEYGTLVGLQGRRKNDANTLLPKMYNLKGFRKTEYLYGLDVFKKANPNTKMVCLCEGQGDAIRAYELMGKPCFCAIMGKEISDTQVELIKKNFSTVVLCLDNDGPGHYGAKKCALKLLKAGLNVKMTHVFTKKDIGALTNKIELCEAVVNAESVYLKQEKISDKNGVEKVIERVSFFNSPLDVLHRRRKIKAKLK